MTDGNVRVRRVRVSFFWQLIIAFVLIIVIVGGGMFLAGRAALNELEPLTRDASEVMARILADRLAIYYDRQGSWQGVDGLIANYASGAGWKPWDEDWQMEVIVATADGTIVADATGERLGQTLGPLERARATLITVGDRQVGFLSMSPFVYFGDDPPPVVLDVVRRFLLVGLAIGGFTLLLGLVLSRSISRPLADLTAATRAVAAGDLDVRVSVRHHGEAGELAVAFNAMAEELARADELRRNLTADVAHELRTPLSVIRARLEGVLDGVYPATPEHLEPVLEGTRLLTCLVEDLHLLAQAEAGQLVLDKRAVDVGDLLRDARVNFGPQASDRGVTLALDLPPELPRVMADGRRIAQVLGNLLTNALRHTPEGGSVTLSAAEGSAGMVKVTVADTGTGVQPEDLPYVFERFWRGEKSRSRIAGGSGLGLAIARQLVEMHGGTIGVESTPGQGARFWFTLPAGDL